MMNAFVVTKATRSLILSISVLFRFTLRELVLNRLTDKGGHAVRTDKSFNARSHLVGQPDLGLFYIQWWSPHARIGSERSGACQKEETRPRLLTE